MVTIIGYKERENQDGESFFVLEVHGGIEMKRSQMTGNFYATAKKAYVPSTFDEQTCSALIGTQMDGEVIKEECEPYEYTVKETGDQLILSHRWVFVTDDLNASKNSSFIPGLTDVEHFSKNGVAEFA